MEFQRLFVPQLTQLKIIFGKIPIIKGGLEGIRTPDQRRVKALS